MPKSISNIHDSEDLGSMKACCNVIGCWGLVILPQYSTIQVFRIKTDAERHALPAITAERRLEGCEV